MLRLFHAFTGVFDGQAWVRWISCHRFPPASTVRSPICRLVAKRPDSGGGRDTSINGRARARVAAIPAGVLGREVGRHRLDRLFPLDDLLRELRRCRELAVGELERERYRDLARVDPTSSTRTRQLARD